MVAGRPHTSLEEGGSNVPAYISAAPANRGARAAFVTGSVCYMFRTEIPQDGHRAITRGLTSSFHKWYFGRAYDSSSGGPRFWRWGWVSGKSGRTGRSIEGSGADGIARGRSAMYGAGRRAGLQTGLSSTLCLRQSSSVVGHPLVGVVVTSCGTV